MKRLTISMSDELFDRLDEIENKSLFVRDIIERELSSEAVDENEGLAERLSEVETQLKSIQSMLQSMPSTGKIEKTVPSIEFKSIEELASEKPSFDMPELTPPVEEVTEKPSFDMPEFTPPVKEATEKPSFDMPELTSPVKEATEKPSVAMPDLAPAEETIVIPPMPDVTSPSLFESSTPAPASPSVPTTPTQPAAADKPDKMEGNILMYMPHGTEIKRSIIISLISKRYDPDDIDAKLNQMISVGTLLSMTKDDTDYLVRA